MAKLRKAVAYRRIERPYTRKSKYRKKNFVRSVPASKVVRYEMGNKTKKFQYKLLLKSKSDIQIRHNALESARQTSNRVLDKKLGKIGYFLKIRVYPHHVLRENALASGAGADRLSTGMKMSFGKTVGIAAQIRKKQPIFEVGVDKNDIPTAKTALTRARHKFPCDCSIEIIDNNAPATPVKKPAVSA